ncbi:MAG: ComEC/Rec2 family competence protein [Spirochaetes bacterium]|jgi:ComEC/Rec2-related protein|nr:ComEC/Rec2 family competence protein [Spirochaetota bacterium]
MELHSAQSSRRETCKRTRALFHLPSFRLLICTATLTTLLYYINLSLIKDLIIFIGLFFSSVIYLMIQYIKNKSEIKSKTTNCWNIFNLLILIITTFVMVLRFHLIFSPELPIGSVLAVKQFRHTLMLQIATKEGKAAAFIPRKKEKKRIKVSKIQSLRKISSDSDFNIMLLRKGIRLTAYCKTTTAKERLPIRNRLQNSINDSLGKTFPQKQSALIKALLFGDKSHLSRKTLHTYKKAGLLHLLAASGMHIAIVSGSIFFILKLISRNKRFSLAGAAVTVLLYVLITEVPVSLLRAAVMFWIYTIFTLCGKGKNALNALMLSATAIIIIDPSDLYSLGFHLSFGATLGILLFFQTFKKHLPAIPFKISDSIALSLSAQLAVIPILFFTLGEYNPASLLSTILAAPLLLLFIYGSCAQAITAFLPQITYYLSIANTFFFRLLAFNAELFKGLNLLCNPDSFIALILPMGLLVSALFLPPKKKQNQIFIITAMCYMLLIPIWYNQASNLFSNRNNDRAGVSIGKNKQIIVSYTKSLVSSKDIITELNRKNANQVVLTISRQTPIGWIKDIIRAYPVQTVIFTERVDKKKYRTLVRFLKQENIEYKNGKHPVLTANTNSIPKNR